MNLKYEKQNVYEKLNKKEVEDMNKYTDEYIEFMNFAKTEYRAIEKTVEILKKSGFKSLMSVKRLKQGDKVYFVNRSKSLYAAVIGKDDIETGVKMLGAHVDSPRIDLKPMPIYENNGMGLLKTQYYGGIKKYQWMTTPLCMYGVIYDKNGKKIEISIGDDKQEPCFTISDLPPHVSADQLKNTANKFIDPEKMSVLFGSYKSKAKKKEDRTVKNNILELLYEKYGIEEIDFVRSEISFVPQNEVKYVGIDKSMIGAYGHDDRVCVYSSIRALTSVKDNNKTAVIMLCDKEEIGSAGNTSMNSNTFDMFLNKLIKLKGEKDVDLFEVYYNSKMLSADVSSAIEPCYEELYDKQNSNLLGYGVCLEKYTGAGGKYNASDANAKFVSDVMNIFDKEKVIYQTGNISKIEKGGGYTVAFILANKGVEVIDCGTPVLGMHSPFEIVSCTDTYMTYKAYSSFLK